MFKNIMNTMKSYVVAPTKHKINAYEVVEELLIAEGGYAYVYRVSDMSNPQAKYALKKINIIVTFSYHSYILG